MVELRDHPQLEVEGKLQFHLPLTLMAQILISCWIQFYIHLEKTVQWYLDINSFFFFLILDGTVPLVYFPNSCCNLCVLLYT